MPEILFLLGDIALARNDNHERLPRAFRTSGWEVTDIGHDSVALRAGRIYLGPHTEERFDLIWPMGFGRQQTFFDRMQLLRQLTQTRFVTEVDALLYLHGKYHWLEHMPETHADNDVATLLAVIAGGGTWVAKPTAGSYGRDVHLLAPGQDHRAVLERLTGGDLRQYCLLQRYVPEIERGEKRSLVAGGRIIGSYLRMPDGGLANLASGGTAQATSLSAAEESLVSEVARDLTGRGVGFAAVDVAYPYLMEVNVANPGGLATLESLTGADFSRAVVDAIVAWRVSGERGRLLSG